MYDKISKVLKDKIKEKAQGFFKEYPTASYCYATADGNVFVPARTSRAVANAKRLGDPEVRVMVIRRSGVVMVSTQQDRVDGNLTGTKVGTIKLELPKEAQHDMSPVIDKAARLEEARSKIDKTKKAITATEEELKEAEKDLEETTKRVASLRESIGGLSGKALKDTENLLDAQEQLLAAREKTRNATTALLDRLKTDLVTAEKLVKELNSK